MPNFEFPKILRIGLIITKIVKVVSGSVKPIPDSIIFSKMMDPKRIPKVGDRNCQKNKKFCHASDTHFADLDKQFK